jgi:uncharacterized membrane protein YdbT with pleckstrin-like domain
MAQLLVGENMVVPPIRRHWIVPARGAFLPGLAAAVLLTAAGLVPGLADYVRLAIGGVGLAIPALAWTYTWVSWHAATLTLTDQRIILEEGVIARTSTIIGLNRVQNVHTAQDVMGRFLDYGTIVIEAAGRGSTELFTRVAHPEMLRDQLFVLSEQRQGRPAL